MRVLGLVLAVLLLAGPSATASDVRPPTDRQAVADALAVLHAWDARRERAWADEDEPELLGLYVPGSAAGRADVGLLGSYMARGLVVRRLVTQVFSLRVLEHSPGRLTVRVLDRVAGGEVERAGNRLRLSSTRAVVRRISLRRSDGVWLVVSVSG